MILKRGGLGQITVWVSNDDSVENSSTTAITNNYNARSNARYNLRPNNRNTTASTMTTSNLVVSPKYWTKIYEKEHKASFHQYEPLDLSDNPIILTPGQVRGIYIHSSIDNDSGIVYDNQQHIKTHEDNFITVLPGRAHVCTKPFGTRPIWGYGNAWRGKTNCAFYFIFY